MRNTIRLLVAIAFLATAIPVPAQAGPDGKEKARQTTKKKTADRSQKTDKFIDKNNNGVDDRKERKAVRSRTEGVSSFAVPAARAPKRVQPAASVKGAKPKPASGKTKPALEKPKTPKKPTKIKLDKSKAEKKPVKRPE